MKAAAGAMDTTTNEANAATHIPTSPNTAYEVVQATAEDRDIDTKINEAYVATGAIPIRSLPMPSSYAHWNFTAREGNVVIRS